MTNQEELTEEQSLNYTFEVLYGKLKNETHRGLEADRCH